MILPPSIQSPLIKPTWNFPVGVMESIVMYNCRKHGMPVPAVAHPVWEGAGNKMMDLSGNGKHGAIDGASWKDGELNFDGTNDFVVSPYYALGGSNPFTVAFRFKTNNNAVTQEVVQQWNNIYLSRVFRVTVNAPTAQNINFRVRQNGNVNNFDISAPINTNQEYFVVGTFDGTNTELFVDAISKGTNNPGALVTGDSDTTVYFGQYGLTTGSYFNGALDTPYIFETNLTPSQVKFISDDPYFMFRIPEELYGYVAAAAGVSIPVFVHIYNQMRQ